MSSQLLVIVLSGPESAMRARQGIKFALNTARTGMMNEVELLFFGSGVSLFDPAHDWYEEFGELVSICSEEGVAILACTANAKEFRITERVKELGARLLGAQIHIAARMRDGYGVITF